MNEELREFAQRYNEGVAMEQSSYSALHRFSGMVAKNDALRDARDAGYLRKDVIAEAKRMKEEERL